MTRFLLIISIDPATWNDGRAFRSIKTFPETLRLWLFFLYCRWVAPYGIVNSKLQSTLPVAFNVRIYPWRFLALSGRGEKVDTCHGCNSQNRGMAAKQGTNSREWKEFIQASYDVSNNELGCKISPRKISKWVLKQKQRWESHERSQNRVYKTG